MVVSGARVGTADRVEIGHRVRLRVCVSLGRPQWPVERASRALGAESRLIKCVRVLADGEPDEVSRAGESEPRRHACGPRVVFLMRRGPSISVRQWNPRRIL